MIIIVFLKIFWAMHSLMGKPPGGVDGSNINITIDRKHIIQFRNAAIILN